MCITQRSLPGVPNGLRIPVSSREKNDSDGLSALLAPWVPWPWLSPEEGEEGKQEASHVTGSVLH